MPRGSKLPVFRFGEKSILTDVLVSEDGVAIEPERVHVQRVEQNKRLRRSYDEACGPADILEASLDLKEMPGLGSLHNNYVTRCDQTYSRNSSTPEMGRRRSECSGYQLLEPRQRPA